MKQKEQQKNGLERLGESLASFGAVRLLQRPFKSHMCPESLEKRRERSTSQERTSRTLRGTPRLGKKSGVRFSCKCPKAHDPSELRFPAAESVQRRMDWVKEAVKEVALRSETLPNSAAEREQLKKKKKDEKAAGPPPRPPGSERPRRHSEPLKVFMQRSLDEKAQSLKHAFGMCCEARAKLEERDVATAELRIREARELAQRCLDEARASDSEFVERGSPKTKRAWRPLKDYEKEEMQRRRASVEEEAQQILDLCNMLDEEVQLWRRSEPQTLPPPPPPGAVVAPLPPPPPPPVPLGGLRAMEDDVALARLLAQAAQPERGDDLTQTKTEMCAEFLEVGRCALGEHCLFAHSPDELFGYRASRGRDNDSERHTPRAYEAMRQAEERRHLTQRHEQAACVSHYSRSMDAADDATLRRLLLADERPTTAKRW